jgi:hypothetical protein
MTSNLSILSLFEAQIVLPSELEMTTDWVLQVAESFEKGSEFSIRVEGPTASEDLLIPRVAMKVMLNVIHQLSLGNAVLLSWIPPVLSAGQAAYLLQMTESDILQLVADGKIPSDEADFCRTFQFADVLSYKEQNAIGRYDDKCRANDD